MKKEKEKLYNIQYEAYNTIYNSPFVFNFIRFLFISFVIFILGLVGSATATATDYYVSPTTTSTNWTTAQNINTPCTPQTAMSNAVAGDVVYFREGVYELYASSIPYSGEYGYQAILQPSNSGTENNPIVFMAYPGEIPLLNGHIIVRYSGIADAGTNDSYLVDNDVDFVASGVDNWDIFRTTNKEGGAAIDSVSEHGIVFYSGSHNLNDGLSMGDAYEISDRFITSPIGVWRQEYITIDGFKIQSDDGVNAARLIISNHANDFSGKGLIVKNCDVYGGDRKIVHGDNREGIRVERTEGAIVSNCKVYGFNHMTTGHNTGAFKTYDNNNLLFENNEIYDSTNGMYIKRRTDGAIIRNNYIHDCYEGIIITSYISAEYSSERNIFIYNNVITYSESATLSDNVQETSDSDNMHIYNNIFYTGNSKAASVNLGSGRKFFYNNILMGVPQDYDMGHLKFTSNNPANAGVLVRMMGIDHNLFDPTSSSSGLLIRTINYNEFNERISTNYWSMLDWQSSGELDGGGNPGEGSFVGDPLFVDTSGTMSELDDFRLNDGSPCIGTGRGGVDIGADINLVGINAGQTSSPTIYTLTLPSITVNTNYSQTIQTTGGTIPYTYSITAGNLPTGLTLNASSGVISGTPTVGGVSNFTIQVTDSDSSVQTDTQELSITVIANTTTYNISNFIQLVIDWLKNGIELTTDINNDEVVDSRDLGIMMSNWRE